jgi:hypothetical protein
MTTLELERAAYMAGDTATADLLAQIDDLTEALGRAVAEYETLSDENHALADQNDELRGELDECIMASMRPLAGIGETEFKFQHPSGDELVCYVEIDEGDETQAPRAVLLNAYLGAVDVYGLLPAAIVGQIEREAVAELWR